MRSSQKVTPLYPAPSYSDLKTSNIINPDVNNTKTPKIKIQNVMNPLVDAAKSVFTAVCELHSRQDSNELSDNLRQELIASIRAFVVRAGQLGYNQELILVARYMLSATVEEAMIRQEERAQSADPPTGTLLKTLGVEPLSRDQWNNLMTRLCDDAVDYIDTLEFIYLCLRLDLKGHYAQEPAGESQRLTFTDELYQIIAKVRGETAFLLSPRGLTQYVPRPVKVKLFKPLHAWIITGVLVGIMYSYFCYSYIQASAPLRSMLQQAETVLVSHANGSEFSA